MSLFSRAPLGRLCEQRGTCAGGRRWEPPPPRGRGEPDSRYRSPPLSRQGQHYPCPARASPLLPQSPPPTPSLPPPPLAPLSPARPRSARAPLRCRGSRSPGVRPAEPSPGGHGDAPGLPTFGLGASAPPAAPRRLPAPPGAQRFRAPRTRIPAGGRGHGVLGAGVGSWVTDSCVLWGWEPSRDFGVPEAARAWRSRTWRFPWEPP